MGQKGSLLKGVFSVGVSVFYIALKWSIVAIVALKWSVVADKMTAEIVEPAVVSIGVQLQSILNGRFHSCFVVVLVCSVFVFVCK